MLRDLKSRIQENIKNYKKPDPIELTPTELKAFKILAAPKKKLTLSQKKAYKVLKAPKKIVLPCSDLSTGLLTSSQTKLNKARAIFLKYEQHKKKSRSA